MLTLILYSTAMEFYSFVLVSLATYNVAVVASALRITPVKKQEAGGQQVCYRMQYKLARLQRVRLLHDNAFSVNV